jgi:hypothetical protein
MISVRSKFDESPPRAKMIDELFIYLFGRW